MTRKTVFKNAWAILKDSFKEFSKDKVLKLSAALAYYTVFSLPSVLIVIIGLCSIFFGREAAQGKIVAQIGHMVGPDAALQIQDILKKTTLHHDNFLATIIGFVTLLLGATGMFGEIQDSINSIWGLKASPKKGFMKIVINRLMSFSMVLVLGFILLVSLILNTVLDAFFDSLHRLFSDKVIHVLYYLDYLVMFGIIATLFAFIFKGLPDAKVHWRDVWIGAVVTAVLFLLGKFVISYLLMHNSNVSAYGAAGSIIVILLWVYYSAIILYFGAEFTQVHVRFHGRAIEPNKYAVWVEQRTVQKESNTEIKKTTEPVKETRKEK
ncbi:MAG: YihY/virulence factor BrkB family protein [Bacteroidia bacterium]